jgi:hypothetical protein
MANNYNHLAICLACIEFNGRVYATEHKLQIQKSVVNLTSKMQFL